MPRLYIANCTKQDHLFLANLPERPGNSHIKQFIKAGQQIALDGLESNVIEDIVRQHEPYGLRCADEISRIRDFVGQCYRVDKPVPLDAMLSTFETNDSALDELAAKRRQVEAAAISEGIAENLSRITGHEKETVRPVRLEMQTVEDTKDTPSIAAGVEVVNDPARTPPRRAKVSTR